MSKEQKLVQVYRAQGEVEALIIKGKLEDAGIPALLKSLAAPSVHPFTVDGMGKVDVMVPASMADDAKEILKGDDNAQMVE